MRNTLILAAVALAVFVVAIGYLTEGDGIDPNSGEKCPGKFNSFGCRIYEGYYRDFEIGMNRASIFEGICSRTLVTEFEYVVIDTDPAEIPEFLIEAHNPLVEAFPHRDDPRSNASFFSRSFHEFCDMKDVEPYAKRLAIRSRLIHNPSLLTLFFEDGKLSEMYLDGHYLDF